MAKRKTARSASRTRTPGATRAVKGGRGTSSTARKTAASRPTAARRGRHGRARQGRAAGSRAPRTSGAKRSLARKSAGPATSARQDGRREAPPNGPLQQVRQAAAPGLSWRSAPPLGGPAGHLGSQRVGHYPATPRLRQAWASADRLPQIERDRRIVEEEVPTPPSSLNLDRRPSAARTGHAEMEERRQEHTAAGPDLTGR